MKILIGIAIGVFVPLYLVLVVKDFGIENPHHFNCTQLCKTVDPLEPELEAIAYEPNNGTLICICKSGAKIEIVPILHELPKHVLRKNQSVQLPQQIYIQKDINPKGKYYDLRAPQAGIDYGGQ